MATGATPYVDSSILHACHADADADALCRTFLEYANSGAGAPTSARQYESKATAAVKLSDLFTSGTSWIDSSY
jgi:hypothetical protein